MSGYALELDDQGIVTVTFDLSGKVNVMTDEFLDAMQAIQDQVESWVWKSPEKIKGIILTSAKSTFFAGGDLDLMRRSAPGDEQLLFDYFERLKGYFRWLEKLEIPVVAAINGTALGGGCELSLSCNYRVAMKNERTVIGLPEIDFGILPAAGGVIRLAQMIGLEPSLEYLLTGKKVDVETALEDGLIDAIADDHEQMIAMARDWIVANPAPMKPWDQKRELGAHRLSKRDRMHMMLTPARMVRRFGQDNPAPARIADIAAQSLYIDFDTVSKTETRAFVALVLSENAKSRISAFFKRD